ncbi:hypothetical protein CDV31_013456 [Fusarium ambrosium]|uniref:Uncharacterized protein n=1 Tax=Fusarium ambrosium TaxID=131363 RepID=A0A428T367_9HYPO|nr:hypothetical protein CDV31_013456 [Fusarium ambrosium]
MTSNEHDTRAAGKAPKGHKEEETMQINLMRLRQLQRFYLDLKNEKRSIPFERGLTRAKLLKMIHDAGPDFMQQVELVSPLLSPEDKPFKDNERWMKNWSRVPNSFSTSFTNHKKIVARMVQRLTLNWVLGLEQPMMNLLSKCRVTVRPKTAPLSQRSTLHCGAAVVTDLTNTSRQVRFADSDASTTHAARLFPGKQQSSDPDTARSLSPAVRPKPGRVRDGVERDASQLQQLRTPAGRADTDKKDKGNDLTEEQAEEDKEWRTEQLRAWYRWWHKGHVERESARSANK